MKRLFDVLFSTLLIFVLFPVILVIAIAIKLESRGPVFFCQQRVGYLGKIFSIFKFRSMINDAENRGPHYTKDNDNRITNVGRFLRKTSLDELPQIINVFTGDMSFIGPRPDVPEQCSNYTPQEWDKRSSIRPGITGLAQAMMRSSGTLDERTRFDFKYIDNVSIWLDIWIILLTVKQLFISKNNN